MADQQPNPDEQTARPLTPGLRKPPSMGGPKRVEEEPAAPAPQPKKSALKKAMPYLIAAGSTGLGIGIGFSNFFSS